jgi:hypothetical protein
MRLNYPMWQKLEEAVRAGHGQPQFGKMDQAQQQMYSAGVEAFTAQLRPRSRPRTTSPAIGGCSM